MKKFWSQFKGFAFQGNMMDLAARWPNCTSMLDPTFRLNKAFERFLCN